LVSDKYSKQKEPHPTYGLPLPRKKHGTSLARRGPGRGRKKIKDISSSFLNLHQLILKIITEEYI
jgi:hypothetical protein